MDTRWKRARFRRIRRNLTSSRDADISRAKLGHLGGDGSDNGAHHFLGGMQHCRTGTAVTILRNRYAVGVFRRSARIVSAAGDADRFGKRRCSRRWMCERRRLLNALVADRGRLRISAGDLRAVVQDLRPSTKTPATAQPRPDASIRTSINTRVPLRRSARRTHGRDEC